LGEIVCHIVFAKQSLVLSMMGVGVAALINFGFEIQKKLGPGILTSWLTGKYYTPREEELAFMFVDMKDSTTLAEQLGALKFSALVRDFFRDMTVPLTESGGRISHYIGDEAVVYWRPETAFNAKGCISFFFWFADTLSERAAYYQTTYGTVPSFKAGAHIGQVVATEVGEVKSEIVFHGDVLNTTARIETMCNELGHDLLLSRSLAGKLRVPANVVMTALGPIRLKGKADDLELVAVERTYL
jgi:adenylate cyclase